MSCRNDLQAEQHAAGRGQPCGLRQRESSYLVMYLQQRTCLILHSFEQ